MLTSSPVTHESVDDSSQASYCSQLRHPGVLMRKCKRNGKVTTWEEMKTGWCIDLRFRTFPDPFTELSALPL